MYHHNDPATGMVNGQTSASEIRLPISRELSTCTHIKGEGVFSLVGSNCCTYELTGPVTGLVSLRRRVPINMTCKTMQMSLTRIVFGQGDPRQRRCENAAAREKEAR